MVARPFKDDFFREITLTAVGSPWGLQMRISSKAAKYSKEGDTAISKFLMGTKVLIYHAIGFPVSKLCDVRSYDIDQLLKKSPETNMTAKNCRLIF